MIDLVNAALARATAGPVRDLPSAHTAAVELAHSPPAAGLRVSWPCGGARSTWALLMPGLLHDTEYQVLDLRQRLVSLAPAAPTAIYPVDA